MVLASSAQFSPGGCGAPSAEMRRNLWDGRGWRCREGARWRRVLILLGGLFLSAVVLGRAEGASLTSVRVSNSPAHLHVYANMEGGITEEIKEAIHIFIHTGCSGKSHRGSLPIRCLFQFFHFCRRNGNIHEIA